MVPKDQSRRHATYDCFALRDKRKFVSIENDLTASMVENIIIGIIKWRKHICATPNSSFNKQAM